MSSRRRFNGQLSLWQNLSVWQYLYAAAGPGLAGVGAYSAISARLRFSKMQADLAKLAEAEVVEPSVVVLIPAKDEGVRIRPCLQTVLGQDYAGPMRVLAIDDRSTDETASVMDEFAAVDPRLKVLRIAPGTLPDAWLGKCHALWRGVEKTSAADEWLLFVDSDVTLKPQAVRLALRQAVSRGLDAVSLLTRQTCVGFWEKLLVPVMGASVLGAYIASYTNDDNRRGIAFANGQFFLIRRSAYFEAGGHEAVRGAWTEDVDLMRVLKRSGFKVRLYSGEALAATRMYDNVRTMFRGWARIFAGCSHRRPWRILVTMAVLTVSMMGPLVAFWAGGMIWAGLAVLHLSLFLPVLGFVYRVTGNSVWLVGLFPLTWVMQMGMLVRALAWCWSGRLNWRGTIYPTKSSVPR